MKQFTALLFLVVASVSLGFQEARAMIDYPGGFSIEKVAEGLNFPTAIAFAPDGRIFVAEKAGVVKVVSSEGVVNSQPFITLSLVSSGYTDRGLIGIAIDPNFASNHYVYLAYTYDNNPSNPDGKKTARVVRVTENNGVAVAGSEQIILGSVAGTPGTPSCADYPAGSDCIASDSWSHTIGGMRFGPDGKLYVATGDGAEFFSEDPHAFRSQDLNHLSGKILRINTDGTGVSDNPFFTGNASDNKSKVWAYGFRNPYRFNFNPNTGSLFVADVGWSLREEVNKVEAGKNYGWPCREGFIASGGTYNSMEGCPIVGGAYADPIYDYEHQYDANAGYNIGAITGGAFATSETYPSFFRDSYIFGDFSLDFMRYITLDGGEHVASVNDFAINVGFPVEFVTAPDGIVYTLSIIAGEVRRITYGNSVPRAEIQTSETIGDIPLRVEFDGSGSFSPNDSPLSYVWEFGDGQSATGSTATHNYTAYGVYTAQLTVTTEDGGIDVASVVINVTQSGNEVQPFHVSSSIPPAPHFVGTPLLVTSQVGNASGNDAFNVRYIVKDENGTELAEHNREKLNISIAPGTEQNLTQDFFLPVGQFSITLILEASDKSETFSVVENAVAVTIVPRAGGTTGGEPVCPVGTTDSDGDGWGWNPVISAGCKITTTPPLVENPTPGNVSEPICPTGTTDSDGDGWGWNPAISAGCKIPSTPPVANPTPGNAAEPVCPAGTTDSDGDGWGWNPAISAGCKLR